MDEKQNTYNDQDGSIFLALVSFISSIVAIFIMYYIFAAVSLVTALFCIGKKNSRSIAIASIVIVVFTLVIRILNVLLEADALPAWLMNGLF